LLRYSRAMLRGPHVAESAARTPGEEPLAKTSTSTYARLEAGIIVQRVRPGSKQQLEDAKENVECFNRIAQGQRHCVLVDMRAAIAVSKDARDYYESDEAIRLLAATALLVQSAAGKMIGNFFLLVTRPRTPCKMFSDEAEAVRWLRGYL